MAQTSNNCNNSNSSTHGNNGNILVCAERPMKPTRTMSNWTHWVGYQPQKHRNGKEGG